MHHVLLPARLLQAQAVPELGPGTKQSDWSFGASLFLKEPFSDAHVDIRHKTGEVTRQRGRKVRSLDWISMSVKALFISGFRKQLHQALFRKRGGCKHGREQWFPDLCALSIPPHPPLPSVFSSAPSAPGMCPKHGPEPLCSQTRVKGSK